MLIIFQEYPAVGNAAAITAIFNPCPGKDHLLTIILMYQPYLYFLNLRPFWQGFMAIYDTHKCDCILIAPERIVTTDVLAHSRDGALLFVHSRIVPDRCIELLNSETLEVQATIPHDVRTFLEVYYESYKYIYPFFPMMAADDSRVAVLNRTKNRKKEPGADKHLTVSVYHIPRFTRRLNLMESCRRYIRALVPEDKHVALLPLPRPLQRYLLWQSQRASDDWIKWIALMQIWENQDNHVAPSVFLVHYNANTYWGTSKEFNVEKNQPSVNVFLCPTIFENPLLLQW